MFLIIQNTAPRGSVRCSLSSMFPELDDPGIWKRGGTGVARLVGFERKTWRYRSGQASGLREENVAVLEWARLLSFERKTWRYWGGQASGLREENVAVQEWPG